MLKVRSESAEVLYPEDEVVLLNPVDMQDLKRMALKNPRQRIRLCAHRSPGDTLHEMFIVHTRDCYVRPHKHIGKAESMMVLEGETDVVLFNDDGSIRSVTPMGALDSGRIFYQRLSNEIFHMLIIRSDFLVFHEVTEGPFQRGKTVFPDWAPPDQTVDANLFVVQVKKMIEGRG